MGRTLKVFKESAGFKVFQQVKDETEFVPWLNRKPFEFSITFNTVDTYTYETNAEGTDTIGRGRAVRSFTISYESGSGQTFNELNVGELSVGNAVATSTSGILNEVSHYIYSKGWSQTINEPNTSSYDYTLYISPTGSVYWYGSTISTTFNINGTGSLEEQQNAQSTSINILNFNS